MIIPFLVIGIALVYFAFVVHPWAGVGAIAVIILILMSLEPGSHLNKRYSAHQAIPIEHQHAV